MVRGLPKRVWGMKIIGCVDFLSAFDIGRPLELFTDASKEGGLGFVLCQPGEGKQKNII